MTESVPESREGSDMQCREFEQLIFLYVNGELEDSERARVDQHVAGCAGCAAALASEQHWLDALTTRASEEPAPALLTQCRSELAESIDDISLTGWRRWVEMFRPTRWIVLRPAVSAVVLVLLGIVAGNVVPSLLLRNSAQESAPVVTVSGFSNQDLKNVDVSSLTWVPGSDPASPAVELQMTAPKPFTLRGSAGDSDVRRVLLSIVRNSRGLDAGVRLESVDVLRLQSDDSEVRQALAFAARNDSNPGVRLKALESLREFARDPQVRQALLDALMRDDNPGVRVEAINTLRVLCESGTQPDRQVVEVLKDRMRKDPSTYVRLQSAAAIRDLGPRVTY